MGWIGFYCDRCPKGKERVQLVIERAQLNWENETQKLEVIDTALVGTTIYAAVRRTKKDTGCENVFGVVVLTYYDKNQHEFMYKDMDETCGPNESKCPKRIIALLSPAMNGYAEAWRQRCMEQKSVHDELSKLPMGSVIQLKNPQQTLLVVTTYHGRRAYVCPDYTCKASPRLIKRVGYEIVSKPKREGSKNYELLCDQYQYKNPHSC